MFQPDRRSSFCYYDSYMNATDSHILVVDDDPRLRSLLKRYLNEQGFNTHAVMDGIEMFQYLEGNTVDIIILDLMLPGEDGLTLARRIQANDGPPIIMLSAQGDDIDKIIGLEVGADDYLSKPFNPRELQARIQAVLRRNNTHQKRTSPHYHFGDFILDSNTDRCLLDQEDLQLTQAEFALLKILSEHENQILSRDKLIDVLKGYERHPYDRSVDVRITRLRKKIEPKPSSPIYIRTVWGKGYRFTPQGISHESSE